MRSITIRNIPEETLVRLRALSAAERRSMNSEILVLLAEGVRSRFGGHDGGAVPPRALQVAMWKELAGSWQDDRPTAEIIADIVDTRTEGREVSL